MAHLLGDLETCLSQVGPPRKVAWNIIFSFRKKTQKYVLKDKGGGHETVQYQECFTKDYSVVLEMGLKWPAVGLPILVLSFNEHVNQHAPISK